MKNNLKTTVIFVALVVLIFGIYLGGESVLDNSEVTGAELHFIDVGQGDSILIKCSDKNMLIDGGTDFASDSVVSYLESQGVDTLDVIIATHPHDDHIGGLNEVIEVFGAKDIYMPDAYTTTDVFSEFVEAAQASNVIFPKPGDTFLLGEAEFTVLGPISKKYSNLNNYSICLRMTYGSNSFVLTGDAEAIAEKEMIDSGANLLADVLKAGHHGSKTANSEEFLKAVHPLITVISVGEGNSYGLPDSEAVEKIEEYSTVYRTDINGNIVIVSDGANLEVKYDYN